MLPSILKKSLQLSRFSFLHLQNSWHSARHRMRIPASLNFSRSSLNTVLSSDHLEGVGTSSSSADAGNAPSVLIQNTNPHSPGEWSPTLVCVRIGEGGGGCDILLPLVWCVIQTSGFLIDPPVILRHRRLTDLRMAPQPPRQGEEQEGLVMLFWPRSHGRTGQPS